MADHIRVYRVFFRMSDIIEVLATDRSPLTRWKKWWMALWKVSSSSSLMSWVALTASPAHGMYTCFLNYCWWRYPIMNTASWGALGLAGKGFLVVQCPAGPENGCSRRTLLANSPWLECQCQPVGTNKEAGKSGAGSGGLTWHHGSVPAALMKWKRLEWLVVKFYIVTTSLPQIDVIMAAMEGDLEFFSVPRSWHADHFTFTLFVSPSLKFTTFHSFKNGLQYSSLQAEIPNLLVSDRLLSSWAKKESVYR